MTMFGDQVYQYGGMPVNGFMTTGKVWFVKPSTGSDGNTGKTPAKALKTLAKAQSLATADKGDVVYMVAESNTAASTTDYQSSVLAWAKDGVHLIGLDSNPFLGQRARISNLSTAATFTNLFTLSGDNCFIRNIGMFQGAMATNAAASHYCMQVSGQHNRVESCQISGIGHADLDDAGSRSLYVTGAENYFYSNYIGLDTILRATATSEIEVTNIPRTVFDKCIVESWTSLSTFKAMETTSFDRFIIFRDSVLSAVQGITSSVAPTGAIGTTTPNGIVILHNTFVYGYADVASADNTSVYVSPSGGGVAGSVDFGVAKSVDIA